jgi:hypothetical protein
MMLPVSHQQREQTEQAMMVVLCSKQAALRNPAGRVVSLGLGRVSMQDALGREAADTRRFPIGHDVLQRAFRQDKPSSFDIILPKCRNDYSHV